MVSRIVLFKLESSRRVGVVVFINREKMREKKRSGRRFKNKNLYINKESIFYYYDDDDDDDDYFLNTTVRCDESPRVSIIRPSTC